MLYIAAFWHGCEPEASKNISTLGPSLGSGLPALARPCLGFAKRLQKPTSTNIFSWRLTTLGGLEDARLNYLVKSQ